MDSEDCPPRRAPLGLDISKRLGSLGRAVLFTDQAASLGCELRPDRELERNFVRSLRQERASQAGGQLSAASVNTDRAEFTSQGINHSEGGWPKDVNISDPDQKTRYRKKIEKEDDFIEVTRQLARETEKYVRQNNCINVFEEYFAGVDLATDQKPASIASVAVFKDPICSDGSREISQVSWSPSGGRIVLGYCNTGYLAYYHRAIDKSSLVYDINNPLGPLLRLSPESALVSLEFSRREEESLAGGCLSGELVVVDTRQGGSPHTTLSPPQSLGDPLTGLAWLNTKSGCDLVASLGDGRVVRWDVRNTAAPVSILDLNTDREAGLGRFGATGLSYDPSLPYRYLVSTDLGVVFSLSLKTDSVLGEYQVGHQGTVRSVQRNPAFAKIFLTAGDRTLRVCSEDVRSSSILSSQAAVQVTAGSWSSSRPGVIMSGREDGLVETWDLLHHLSSPLLTTNTGPAPVTDIKFNQTGSLALVANAAGSAHLIFLAY